ncbi:MAG: hypothetical protein ACI3XQ_11260 [Eubacteriales bacterium]
MFYYLIKKKDGTIWYKEATEEEYAESETRIRITEEEYLNRDPARERKIAAYRKKLYDTDYIACKIAEGAAVKEEYAETLANRAVWRERINELAEGYPYAEELL